MELDLDFSRTFAPDRVPQQRPAAVPPAAAQPVLTTADLAECTCPDFCERDHANE